MPQGPSPSAHRSPSGDLLWTQEPAGVYFGWVPQERPCSVVTSYAPSSPSALRQSIARTGGRQSRPLASRARSLDPGIEPENAAARHGSRGHGRRIRVDLLYAPANVNPDPPQRSAPAPDRRQARRPPGPNSTVPRLPRRQFAPSRAEPCTPPASTGSTPSPRRLTRSPSPASTTPRPAQSSSPGCAHG